MIIVGKPWVSSGAARAVDYSLPAQRVIRLLDRLVKWYGKPERLRSDNGPEFISQDLQDWCSNQQIELHHIAPGKPTQNAYIERFNAGPPVRYIQTGSTKCPYVWELATGTPDGGSLVGGIQYGAAPSGLKVHDVSSLSVG